MSDTLLQDQLDIAARLEADATSGTVPVLIQRKGVTESDIEIALGTLNSKSNKMGALLIVLMPSLEPVDPESPGPRYRIIATVQAIEQPLFNLGDDGTGISAEQLAERVRQLLHHCNLGRGSVWTFSGMEPVEQGGGKIAYGVRLSRLAGDSTEARQPTPTLVAAGSTITATADPLAAVYYTLDGTYPHAGNTAATLYAAPVTMTEPGTFRAVAYRTGYLPSNVATATIS